MNLALSDFSFVNGRRGKLLRFSLSIIDDDGHPGMTVTGCLMDEKRKVSMPSCATRGRVFRSTTLSDKWYGMVEEALIVQAKEHVDRLPPTETEELKGEVAIKL